MHAQLHFRCDRPKQCDAVHGAMTLFNESDHASYIGTHCVNWSNRQCTSKDCQAMVMRCCRSVLEVLPQQKEQLQHWNIFNKDKG